MGINDIVRQFTFEIEDEIKSLTEDMRKLTSEIESIELRKHQITTEIKRFHNEEREVKSNLHEVEKEIETTNKEIDDLERRKQELVENLMSQRGQQEAKEKELSKLRELLQKTQQKINDEEDSKHKCEVSLGKKLNEKKEKESLKKERLMEALKTYIQRQEESLHLAFGSLEEKEKQKRATEEFDQARQRDPRLADLYEQREELSRLLKNASLESIQNYLKERISTIEDEISKAFPGALSRNLNNAQRDNVLEILYAIDKDQTAIFWLPFTHESWTRIEQGEVSQRSKNVVCFLWNMITQLDLTGEGSRVDDSDELLCFRSGLSRDDVMIFGQFNVVCNHENILKCILTEAPYDLQEALLNED
jgi:chromosome segregation ATPase